MEEIQLKDFIEGALVNIAQGIRNANLKLKNEHDITANIYNLRRKIGDSAKIPGIQFDVAVTASKQDKDKAGFVIALLNIGVGANIERSTVNELVHRIKFEIGIDSHWV
jgi:hypothetical protein